MGELLLLLELLKALDVLDARFIQTPTPPPSDLLTLLWFVVGALATVVGVLFRLLQLEQAKYQALLTNALQVLATNAEAMKDMKKAADDIATLTDIRTRLERIEKGRKDGKATTGD